MKGLACNFRYSVDYIVWEALCGAERCAEAASASSYRQQEFD